jgi:phosphate/sulfate permease
MAPRATLLGGVGVLLVGAALSAHAHYVLNVHCNALAMPASTKHSTVAALAAASLQVRKPPAGQLSHCARSHSCASAQGGR